MNFKTISLLKITLPTALLLFGSCVHLRNDRNNRDGIAVPPIQYTSNSLELIRRIALDLGEEQNQYPKVRLPNMRIGFSYPDVGLNYIHTYYKNNYFRDYLRLEVAELSHYFELSKATSDEKHEFLTTFNLLSEKGIFPVRFYIDEDEVNFSNHLLEEFQIQKPAPLHGYRGFLQEMTFTITEVTEEHHHLFNEKYTRYKLQSGETHLNINLMERTRRQMREGNDVTVYFLSEVTSGENGHPLSPPASVIIPLAISVDDTIFFVNTLFYKDFTSYAAMPSPFLSHTQRIAIFRNPHYSVTEVLKVLEVFEKNAGTSLAESNLKAERVVENHGVRGRLRFFSANRSEVLRGVRGPYYESSSYTLTIYSLDETDLVDSNQVLASRGAEFNYGRIIYIEIDYINLVSVGMNERFYSANEEHRRLYLEEIQKTVARALQLTAEELGVEIQNNTLVIP